MSRRLDRSVTVRVAGHFGEWLQGRLGPDGPVCLLTLPCPPLFVEVERLDDGPLELLQSVELVTLDRARDFLSRVSGREGVYRLKATMPPGGGAGASTGALVGLANAAGGLCEKVVDACVAVEGASDPLMLPRPDGVLWASREGRAVRSVPTLPVAEIIGGFWGPPVFTDPGDGRFPDVADLGEKLLLDMSLQALSEVASASAKRCASLRGPVEDPTERLAAELGALGFLRAHTGSARGLIFAPGTVPYQAEAVLCEAGFKHVLRFTTGGAKGDLP